MTRPMIMAKQGGWRRGGSTAATPAPLISLITSTLNAGKELTHTVASVAGQRSASLEWIVVDGGSVDATVDVLRQNEQVIAHWLSEPDAGVYDAWNKACALARGQWLIFIGAGDEFDAPDTLASISPHLQRAHPAHDLVYGKLRYISAIGRQDLDEAGVPWDELEGSWELCRPALPPHGALFHHRSLFADGKRFDARFRIAGDAHFLLRHAMRKPPLFVPMPLIRTPLGGLSMDLRNAAAIAREISLINRELGIVPPLRHRIAEGLLLVAKTAAGCVPAGLGRRAADLYRRLAGLPPRWSVR